MKQLKVRPKFMAFLAILLAIFFIASPLVKAYEVADPEAKPPRVFNVKGDDPKSVEDDDQVILYFFKETCPYCEEVSALLTAIPDEVPTEEGELTPVKLIAFNKNEEVHGDIIQQYYEDHDVPEDRRYVPMLVVGEKTLFLGDEIVPELLPLLFAGEGLKTPREYLPEEGALIYEEDDEAVDDEEQATKAKDDASDEARSKLVFLYDEACLACDGTEAWKEAMAPIYNLNLENIVELQFVNRQTNRKKADALLEEVDAEREQWTYPLVLWDGDILLEGEDVIKETLADVLIDHLKVPVMDVFVETKEQQEVDAMQMVNKLKDDGLDLVLHIHDANKIDVLEDLESRLDEADIMDIEAYPVAQFEDEWSFGTPEILELIENLATP